MLLSYKNNPELKIAFVREIEKHRKADALERGHYGKENGKWKGCAVACSLRSLAILNKEKLVVEYKDHKKLAVEILGGEQNEWLARLEDTIFEGLSVKESKQWPTQFSKATPVGKNLEPIKWKFCTFILKENIDRVLTLEISDGLKKQVVDAIRGVFEIHEKAIQTGKWDESVAESARSAAWSAAESAAESARSAAWSAARSAAYPRYAKELLRLLKTS